MKRSSSVSLLRRCLQSGSLLFYFIELRYVIFCFLMFFLFIQLMDFYQYQYQVPGYQYTSTIPYWKSRFRHVRGSWRIVCKRFRKKIMTPTKSSESPLQNKLKIFVDDQKLKKLCVSTFESAHVFLLAFCHIEPSALRIRFFWSHHSNFFFKAPLKKVKTSRSLFCSRDYNDLIFFHERWFFCVIFFSVWWNH